jgi:hypothetical protein
MRCTSADETFAKGTASRSVTKIAVVVVTILGSKVGKGSSAKVADSY